MGFATDDNLRSEEYNTLVKALKYGLTVLDEKNIADFGEDER